MQGWQMPALPCIETEGTRKNSAEKKPYRLSLRTESKKSLLGDFSVAGKQTSDNDFDVRSESSDNLWNNPRSRYFQEMVSVPHRRCIQDTASFSTIMPPTPSPSLKVAHSKKEHRSLPNYGAIPRWLDALGIWVPSKQKVKSYESFTKNKTLNERSADMFLDPFPYLPRCNHARTLSALNRQHQRMQAEDETRRKQRCLRIIDRLTQLREVWDSWKNKAEKIGAEHFTRLDAFRKSKEMYIEPSEFIRKKRELRQQREKEFREKQRQRLLELREQNRVPKIIVTNYDEEVAALEAEPLEQKDAECNRTSPEPPGEESRQQTEEERDSLPEEGHKTECEVKTESGDAVRERLSVPILTNSTVNFGEISSQSCLDFDVVRPSDKVDGLEEHVCESTERVDLLERDTFADRTGDSIVISAAEETVRGTVTRQITANKAQTSLSEVAETATVLGKNSAKNAVPQSETIRSEGSFADTATVLGKNSAKNAVPQSETIRSGGSLTSCTNGGDVEREGKLESDECCPEVGFDPNLLNAPSLSSLREYGRGGLDIAAADETVQLMSTNVPVPLGVAGGLLSDDSLQASSSQDRYSKPHQARLHNTPQGKNVGAWKPKSNDNKQFLQVDLGSLTTVMQVATQGCPSANETSKRDKCWVKSYSLSYSKDGKKWEEYREGDKRKEFKGNKDNDSVVVNSLASPIEAQFVRFMPRSWKNSIAMRVEVMGEFPDVGSHATGSIAGDQELPEEEGFMEVQGEELHDEVHRTEALSPVDTQEPWEENMAESIIAAPHIQLCTVARLKRGARPPLANLAVQGSKSLNAKPRVRKPKPEKKEKKKMKKRKSRGVKLPSLVPSAEAPDEDDGEERSSTEEEQEEVPEEEPLFVVPPLPDLPQQAETTSQPHQRRRVSMFSSVPPTIEADPKPRRRRVTTDSSIRMEMLRQQVAEDRRQKLRSAVEKLKKTDHRARTPSPDFDGSSPFVDDFLAKNCIFSDGQRQYYQRMFNYFDEDQDGYLFPEQVLEALEVVNSNLLSDSHLNYIYRVLDLCDCSLDSGADLKLFSVVAALSQRIAALDEFAKILMAQLDFKELDYKLQKAKMLFTCYVDEVTRTIPLEILMLDLMAGGLTSDSRNSIMQALGRTSSLDFLDFLTYIPLFIHIHDHVLSDPLGSVS